MMKYVFGIVMFAALVVSCGGGENKETEGENKFYTTEVPEADVLRVGIKQLEDSIMKIDSKDEKLKNLVQQACIEKLKLMYQAYPEDKDAALSLHKVSMMYSAMGVPKLSVQYGDSLVEKYPKYPRGWLALQSNAAYYDYEAKPRDKEKVRYYHETILKNYPNLDPEILEQSRSRLETIDMSLEELMEQQNPSL